MCQTETSYYDEYFTDGLLLEILNKEKSTIIKDLSGNDKKIVESIVFRVENSDNIELIESNYSNKKLTIVISNSFMKTLAKITDAVVIQSAIDPSKNMEEYFHYCIDHSTEKIIGPATFYKLDKDQLSQYVSRQSTDARFGFFILSLRFVLLHEIAHHILNHLDGSSAHKLTITDQEIEADNYALDFFRKSGWTPLFSAPLLYYFYLLDNSKDYVENTLMHPSGIERVSSLINSCLNNLEDSYRFMSSKAPITMSFEKLQSIIYYGGLTINSDLLEDMDQDYETYLKLAKEGNIQAQVKMGMMHFKGTNGWIQSDDMGFQWLIPTANNSQYGAFLLGMFYEYKGNLDKAIEAYSQSASMGNYYAKELLIDLVKWKSSKPMAYRVAMTDHIRVIHRGCLESCQSNYPYTKDECNIFYCNYSIHNMHDCLMRFREKYPF